MTQHGTTRVQPYTVQDNTSTTRDNTSTTWDNASKKQHKIYFAWFIYIISAYSEPSILGSEALFKL